MFAASDDDERVGGITDLLCQERIVTAVMAFTRETGVSPGTWRRHHCNVSNLS